MGYDLQARRVLVVVRPESKTVEVSKARILGTAVHVLVDRNLENRGRTFPILFDMDNATFQFLTACSSYHLDQSRRQQVDSG